MKDAAEVALRCLIIIVCASPAGLFVNAASPWGVPLVYVPPKEKEVSGAKIPLIDEKRARAMFDDPQTVFVDARTEEELLDGRIKGAVSLPGNRKEEMFPRVQPLLPESAGIILYCSGPECHLAEDVAGFPVGLGYKRLFIMAPGFSAWEKSGYPVEKDDP
ncbi:MAG: rhodanese-like domain-containing protein [Pseudomonadota bacterium]